MTDIAPELLEAVKKSFEAKTKGLGESITKGVKNYEEAYYYAIKAGEALAKAFMANITSEVLPDGMMYYNIANRVVLPMLRAGYEISSAAAVQAQKSANKAAGIGIKPQEAEFDEEKAKGIIDRVSSEPFEDISWILDEPVKTFSKSVVDQTLEKNVEFQGKSGLSPKIRRTASMDACEWCQSLEGTYEYPDVPEDVYHRHANCNCVVEYIEGGKRQNVWSKQVSNESRTERITESQRKIKQIEEDNKIKSQEKARSFEEKYFKSARFKSPLSNSDIEWFESVGGLGISADITSEDRSFVNNNIHTVSAKENIGKTITLSSMDYVYAIELNDFLDYNILWKVPNDDDLNDAIAQIKSRRK